MKQHVQLFVSASIISFLGSLPLGILNITITNISLQEGFLSALNFAIGAIIVEIIIVKLSFTTILELGKINPLLKKINWASIVMLFVLSIYFLVSAIKNESTNATAPIKIDHMILWGALLSFLNPLHLPFWMVWSSILKSRGLLTHNLINQINYLFAIALGTGLAFCLYAVLGTELTKYLKNQAYLVNGIIGFSLFLAGIIQLYNLKRK